MLSSISEDASLNSTTGNIQVVKLQVRCNGSANNTESFMSWTPRSLTVVDSATVEDHVEAADVAAVSEDRDEVCLDSSRALACVGPSAVCCQFENHSFAQWRTRQK